MNAVYHFALEMEKLAFTISAPPVLSTILGKATKGVVAKPQTAATMSAPVKTSLTQKPKSVPAVGKVVGAKINPAKAESPPPAVRGGTNVR